MSNRKRLVEGKFPYYVCMVHGWDFTEEEGSCPVCLGESYERNHIIMLLRTNISYAVKVGDEMDGEDNVLECEEIVALIRGEE